MLNLIKLVYFYFMIGVVIPIPFIFIALIFKLYGIKTYFWYNSIWVWLTYVTKTNTKITGKLIPNGIIFCNHRSICDGGIDLYYNKAMGIGRLMYIFLYTMFQGLLALIENNNYIGINRNKTTSKELFFEILKYYQNNRIILYPEGSRKRIDYNKVTLEKNIKWGTIKRIYENKNIKIPLQITIGINKEKILDVKQFDANQNVNLNYIRSKEFYAINFNSFDDFKNHILDTWIDIITHVNI